MANAAKNKGDRAEREAVRVLVELAATHAPGSTLDDAQRKLGAGRREDTGDLHVFADTAIQVRNYAPARIGIALRSAAADSVTQAGHGRLRYGLGMVPVPGARSTSVRWLAAVQAEQWPAPLAGCDLELLSLYANVTKAIAHLRDERDPAALPRTHRVVRLGGAQRLADGTTPEPILVAPIEAWLAAYRLRPQLAPTA